MAKATRDIHQEVTDQMIEALENGTAPWVKNWDGAIGQRLPLRANGEPYQGINVFLLTVRAFAAGFVGSSWMTFRQAKELGGSVRKGEKSTSVVFFKAVTKRDEKEPDNDDKARRFGFLKTYNVFNVDQIDGLPERFFEIENKVGAGEGHIPDLEQFFANTGAKIEHGAHIAPHWRPSTDTIGMPPIEQFASAHDYYGVLAHELTHWTGHTPRLDRDMKYQTTEGRAFEELIAEMGSLFICAHIGARPDHGNSASYIDSWLRALKNDKRFIFRAATAAQQACTYALQRGRPQLTAMAAE